MYSSSGGVTTIKTISMTTAAATSKLAGLVLAVAEMGQTGMANSGGTPGGMIKRERGVSLSFPRNEKMEHGGAFCMWAMKAGGGGRSGWVDGKSNATSNRGGDTRPTDSHSRSEDELERGGVILREVLSRAERQKLNTSPDRDFYSFPRFVKHVDDAFLRDLTAVYEERIPEGSEVFDVMGSWVSHLPPSLPLKRVVGHGMVASELARNKALDSFFIKDLNQDPSFEFGNESFDAITCAVSVQYLQQPEKVFAEFFRILRPGGVCIVSFSNRLFYEKAISAWRDANSRARVSLVQQYFQSIRGFSQPEVVRGPRQRQQNDSPMATLSSYFRKLRGGGNDPFFAVIAYKSFSPLD